MIWIKYCNSDPPEWMCLKINYTSYDEDVCSICLESLDKCIKTECNHYFHYECIDAVNENECPLCRKKLIII